MCLSGSWNADVWENVSYSGSWIFWMVYALVEVEMLTYRRMWVLVEAEFWNGICLSGSWNADVWENVSYSRSWILWMVCACLEAEMLMHGKMLVIVEAEFFEWYVPV